VPLSSPPASPARVAELPLLGGADVRFHDMGSGPAVLLLHGSGPGTTAWRAWAPLATALASGGRRVVAPDLVGFGGSRAAAPPPYGRAAWTAQALALADHLGLERISVVGHSLGGAIALAVACARPEAVEAVVAIASLGARMALPAGLDALWASTPGRAQARALLELLHHRGAEITEDAVDARLEAMLEPGPREVYPALFPPPRDRRLDDVTLAPSELAAVAAPVLLVHGDDDRVVPLREGALALLAALPGARLHVFGRCGHAVPAERGAELERLVSRFLEDHV
jgi:pimeloyl-ACP methyl ester carboxylesterase